MAQIIFGVDSGHVGGRVEETVVNEPRGIEKNSNCIERADKQKSGGEELYKSVQNVDITQASRDEYPLIAREDGGRKEMRRRVRALVHR